MAKLHVAMYTPRDGNYEHWALFLENGDEKLVFQVIGEWPSFKYDVVETIPEATVHHKRSIFLYEVNAVDVPELKTHIEESPVDNETAEWNCQDFVIEVLEKLEEECIVEDDDEDYVKGKKKMMKHYGAK